VGLILGSGLGGCADILREQTVIPFDELPNFPSATVEGHPGRLVLGYASGVLTAALQGRFHYYEGYSMAAATFATRVLGYLGVSRLITTSAAGAVNIAFKPGDLVIVVDHINLMGTNPLIGCNIEEMGPRFLDMSEAYDVGMRRMALEVAEQKGIPVRQGVYLGVSGPSYETPAEVRMCRILGADAVGMSTIPEVIVANHMGVRVLGLSCITNMAAGVLPQRLSHLQVLETAERAKERLSLLLQGIIPRLSGSRET